MKDWLHTHYLDAPDEAKQTRCTAVMYRNGREVFRCVMLAPQWADNARRTSCIPLGLYPLTHVVSPTFGQILAVNNVPDRDLIRIHAGNYRRNTVGCFLPGSAFTHVDSDGLIDVVNSRATLNKLRSFVPSGGCPMVVTADAAWQT